MPTEEWDPTGSGDLVRDTLLVYWHRSLPDVVRHPSCLPYADHIIFNALFPGSVTFFREGLQSHNTDSTFHLEASRSGPPW